MINISEKKTGELNYLLCTPPDFNTDKKYPVIIHFHGAGSRGDDLSVLRQQAIISYAKAAKDFPFVMFLPQCSHNSWFDIFEQLRSFVKTAVTFPYVDERNVYLSGVSMGGYASWQMLMSEPDIFKKAIICCGGGMYWNAARITAPVWALHGTDDTTVFAEESRKMVEAVRHNGGSAKLTEYNGVGHNCWELTYSNPEIYRWLLDK
ncbi:MAG: prolyl oligopeptidase family serine peptidase [Clostridia bacterium]|nr:prolyl oligopeptidase family serine peptidase [Clostridia bacterium]